MDTVDPATRSRTMGAVKGKNTTPEMKVRRVSHALGFRHRIHRKDLPGSPDLVYPRINLALFVHGCFWHSHTGCSRAVVPATNKEFWKAKFGRNTARDKRVADELRLVGWRVEVIWECQTRNADALRTLLGEILKTPAGESSIPMSEKTTTRMRMRR